MTVANLTSIWTIFSGSGVFWLSLTLLVFYGAQQTQRRWDTALFNPVLISIAIISLILLTTQTPYASYAQATRILHFLLGPATVALAVPLYRRIHRLRQMAGPLVGGLVVGSITAVLSAIGIAGSLGASPLSLRSLAPKSATTAIAMGIAEKVQGLPSLTAVLVILTGILGAVMAGGLLDWLKVHEPAVRGFAIGVASHGIGTARAFEMDEEAGAFSGLGMSLNGVLTVILVPTLLKLLGLVP